MHENLTSLDSSKVDSLLTLKSAVTFTDKNIRLGEGGADNRSVLTYSRWYEWNRTQKATFESALGSTLIEKSIVGWFLNIPANTGFLDEMRNWVNEPMAGTVVAYSLTDGQNIVLNGTTVTVNRGEGIRFSLKVPHKIDTSASGQQWACLMQLI